MITFCDDDISEKDFKNLLLARNEEWKKIKDGSSTVNGSLRAVVLGCIDSRVPVEKIFQAKPGELLVLKNAGNLITNDMLRSMIVAIYELKAKFIIILGHTSCGMAILDNTEKIDLLKQKMGEKLLNSIKKLEDKDPLAWFGFFDQGKWEDNAKAQTQIIQKFLNDYIPKEYHPKILTALYDIDEGSVKFL